MAKKADKNIVASLLDLPEFEPETAAVELPRLGIVLELQELPYPTADEGPTEKH